MFCPFTCHGTEGGKRKGVRLVDKSVLPYVYCTVQNEKPFQDLQSGLIKKQIRSLKGIEILTDISILTSLWYPVKDLYSTRHKTGHFGDILCSQSLGKITEETAPNTTKANIHQQHKDTTAQNKH